MPQTRVDMPDDVDDFIVNEQRRIRRETGERPPSKETIIIRITKDYSENPKLFGAAPDLLALGIEALDELRQLSKDIGCCDHAVGICVCGLHSLIERLAEAIKNATGIEFNRPPD